MVPLHHSPLDLPMRHRVLSLTCVASLIFSLANVTLFGQQPPGELRLAPIKIVGIENGLQLTRRIYSGGEPNSEEAFQALAKLGIKTVVSVDGAEPNLAAARRYGIRYVHVPIGYDAVSLPAQLALTRIAREIEGPIFVHCHHGQHRGPAAAAVLCIADQAITSENASQILEAAKTSKDYTGLWRDVSGYRAPASDVRLPDLVERAEVDSFPAAMAKVDRHFDQLKLLHDAHWKAPQAQPDLVPQQEALLVFEQLRESARHLTVEHDKQFRTWLAESEVLAKQLERQLQTGEVAKANESFSALQKSCKQCHTKHRDR